VNYYKHHLGDYDGATSHLDWDEDTAYSRFLRAYYRRERPIPLEIAEACRLIRAVTRPQRQAAERVLNEFFTKSEDGWRNKRCDEEIAAYQHQASTNRRIAGERIVKRNVPRNGDGSSHEASTVGPPNQSQEPETKNQEPETKNQEGQARARAAAHGTRLPLDWTPPDPWMRWAMQERKWSWEETLRVAESFKNYYLAKPGKDGESALWEATWKRWVERERAAGPGPRPGNLLNKQEALEARNAAICDNWSPPEDPPAMSH
jgi:uncharacterized protein YdaU (DUF1376 family)